MENIKEKDVRAFLAKHDLVKLKKEYKFEAPKTRIEMFKTYQETLKKCNGAIGKSLISETLKWAFHNDRRYLGSFLKYLSQNSEIDVKTITKIAFNLARNNQIAAAIRKLNEIKGVGGVTAGKILMFAMPKNFGMYDQFNGKAIYKFKIGGNHFFKKSNPNDLTKKQYAEEFEKYTLLIHAIGKRLKLMPAEVDMALFRLGRGY